MRLPRLLAAAVALLPVASFALPRGVSPVRPAASHSNALTQAAAPANAHLFYYGGPVIANIHIIPVMWGTNVPSAVATGIGPFYTAITDSTYFDWLSEYDTNVPAYDGSTGTNQHLGRGTAEAAITIHPANTKTSITDAEIGTELTAQISAGHLPAATASSLYMIHFPAGMKISMPDGNGGTASSCTQFCAYHSTIQASPQNIFYGVIPNVTSDGCELGCGPVGGGFGNTTTVASHEMIEATTDAAVGLATANAAPLGWYDPQGQDGEIGDICAGTQGTITSHNQSWTVQQEWSNTNNACIVEAASNDFAISLHPDNQNIAAGSSATFTVTSSSIGGSVGTITLDTSGLPTGFTGSFDHSTLAPGGTATLTISVDSSATNGADYFAVHGSAGSLSHSAEGTATVTGGTAGSGGGGGGTCPPGTIDLGGGLCLPTGCSAEAAPTWLALIGFGSLLLRRRRQS